MTKLLHCGQFEALLPWYVNGTASADERVRAESHLQSCAACRGRLRNEQALVRRMRDPADLVVPDCADSWKRFESTLGDAQPTADHGLASARPLRWIVGAQAAALALLSILLAQALWNQKHSAPDYQTVASPQPAPSGFTLRIAAAPGVTPQVIAQIAHDQGGRVVAGPSDLGVYTVELDPAALQRQTLERLRAMPELLLVEQISGR